MQILIADRQGITRAGLMFLCHEAGYEYRYTDDKTELIEALRADGDTIVILDYTLFDIGDVANCIFSTSASRRRRGYCSAKT